MIYNNKRFIYMRRVLSGLYKQHMINLSENNCHMFVSDIESFVSPYSNYTNYGYLYIEFVGDEEDIPKAVMFLEKIAGKEFRTNADLVGGVMRKFTADLLHNNGVKYYKYSFDGEGVFRGIDGFNIFQFLNVVMMIVPDYIQIIEGKNKKYKVYENIGSVLKLSLPKECGGGKLFRDIIVNLSACKDMPHHVIDVRHGNYTSYNNVKNFNMLKSTKDWGWGMRGLAGDRLSETYKYYRKLNFILNLIELRKYFLKELNILLASAGLDVKITIKEKYEISFLQELKCKIVKGTILNSELRIIFGPN